MNEQSSWADDSPVLQLNDYLEHHVPAGTKRAKRKRQAEAAVEGDDAEPTPEVPASSERLAS